MNQLRGVYESDADAAALSELMRLYAAAKNPTMYFDLAGATQDDIDELVAALWLEIDDLFVSIKFERLIGSSTK